MATSLELRPPGATSAPDAEPWHRWRAPAAHASVVGALLWATPPAYALLVPQVGSSWPAAEPTVVVVLGGLASVAGIAMARRHPWWATLLPLVPFLLLPWTGWFVWGWLAALVAVASVAALDGLRRAVPATVAAFGVALVYCASSVPALLPIGPVTSGRQTTDGRSATSWLGLDSRTGLTLGLYVLAIIAVVALSWAAGSAGRARTSRVAALQAQERALTVQSVSAERARLARDLHDVVAHHVSLVAVRAESAPFQHPDLGDDARAVLAAIADDARAALGELRQVLTVLQRSEGAAPDRAPQPGSADVETLVADARSAGQSVAVDGAWGDVPAPQGYVLYRAVQEGLSNARRHAPGAAVRLERRRTSDLVGFLLTNATSSEGPPGRGLRGMRERVVALGGAMSARRIGDEFVLDVELPLGER